MFLVYGSFGRWGEYETMEKAEKVARGIQERLPWHTELHITDEKATILKKIIKV
jgi:hypothetical protein